MMNIKNIKMAYKQKTPFKFLGKALKAVGNVAGSVGGRKSNVAGTATTEDNNVTKPGGMGLGIKPGMHTAGAEYGAPPPFMKKQTSFKKYSGESPLKAADATLVRGAYDAASGKGTLKYAQVAQAKLYEHAAKITSQTFGALAAKRKLKRNRKK